MPKKSEDLNYLNDDRIAKGKKQMMDQTREWKGGSHKERHDEKKVSKREVQKAMAKAQEKVSWKKQAGAIGAVVFMCGAGLCQFLSTVLSFMAGTGIVNVDAKDTAMLKEVLFSGEPWFVYCVNNETQSQRLPKVLEESASSLSSSLGLKTAVLPCWDPTESGRSVAQRFQLSLKPPLSFVVANGNKPKLLNLAGVSKYEDFEKRVKPALKTDTYRIDTLKKWGSLCTSRKTCVVIGHKNTAQRDAALTMFRPLAEKNRAARIVTLDTSFWQLKLDDSVLATRSSKAKGKSAEVLCLAREEGGAAEKGNSTHSGTFMGELDAAGAQAFMKACEARKDLVKLEKTPRINARPSKPKKVAAPTPSPSPRPRPPPPPKEAAQGKVDRVGSRERMENEEPLFEAVEEDEQQGEGGGEEGEDEEGDEDGDEVEL